MDTLAKVASTHGICKAKVSVAVIASGVGLEEKACEIQDKAVVRRVRGFAEEQMNKAVSICIHLPKELFQLFLDQRGSEWKKVRMPLIETIYMSERKTSHGPREERRGPSNRSKAIWRINQQLYSLSEE